MRTPLSFLKDGVHICHNFIVVHDVLTTTAFLAYAYDPGVKGLSTRYEDSP